MSGHADAAAPPEASLPVLVLAAYPAVRAGLMALLAGDPRLEPVAPDRSWLPGQRTRAASGDSPAVIVVDQSGSEDGLTDDLTDAYPDIPLVLLGGEITASDPTLAARPVAYLGPDVDGPTLIAAVRGVAVGLTVIDPTVIGAHGLPAQLPAAVTHPTALDVAGDTLTARERQVLELVASGLPNKAIARDLGISEHTVKFHVGSLLGKLGAGSRTEAVTLATRRGLLAV